jgi:hypothetical protein
MEQPKQLGRPALPFTPAGVWAASIVRLACVMTMNCVSAPFLTIAAQPAGIQLHQRIRFVRMQKGLG